MEPMSPTYIGLYLVSILVSGLASYIFKRMDDLTGETLCLAVCIILIIIGLIILLNGFKDELCIKCQRYTFYFIHWRFEEDEAGDVVEQAVNGGPLNADLAPNGQIPAPNVVHVEVNVPQEANEEFHGPNAEQGQVNVPHEENEVPGPNVGNGEVDANEQVPGPNVENGEVNIPHNENEQAPDANGENNIPHDVGEQVPGLNDENANVPGPIDAMAIVPDPDVEN